MPAKKRAAPVDISRLTILASGDDQAFREHAAAMLDSGNRGAREAALEALVDRPLPALRGELRTLYRHLDTEGEKRDAGGHLRTAIVRVLIGIADVRDIDIGIRASETREISMGVDGTANLRSKGLQLVAATDADLFPYLAVEHVDDYGEWSPEPASTALRILAETGHELSVYQWLVNTTRRDAALVEAAVDLLGAAPRTLMARSLARLVDDAVERRDEPLITKLADTIVERELDDAYPAVDSIMRAPISKELYAYLALLLAATNRDALLAILDGLMDDLRRRSAIVDALRVRTTPEQEAILIRWNVDDEGE